MSRQQPRPFLSGTEATPPRMPSPSAGSAPFGRSVLTMPSRGGSFRVFGDRCRSGSAGTKSGVVHVLPGG